jgi:hypothetical protein
MDNLVAKHQRWMLGMCKTHEIDGYREKKEGL